jgi:hypothetical protein
MRISEDKSLLSALDLLAIEKGYAKLNVYSLAFSGYLTDSQMEANNRLFNSLSRNEWDNFCELRRKDREVRIEKVIDLISANFKIYQYKDKTIDYSNDDWDLFFWCNSGDMSYVTLNFNKKRLFEQRLKDFENILALIKPLDENSIEVAIRYTAEFDERKVTNITSRYFKSIRNQYLTYWGCQGKIKEVGFSVEGKVCYGFFKKGAYKKYHRISELELLQMAFDQAFDITAEENYGGLFAGNQ